MRTDNLTDALGLTDARAPRIDALLGAGEALLTRAGGDAPRLQAELLLSHVLSQPRSHLIAQADRLVPPNAAASYRALLERAAAGEPTAYLIGEREFWSLALEVSAAVLVPRPETELLVERALSLIDVDGPRAVCDLGTGSGAIALALANERPRWLITATDCSPAALELAARNARRHGLHRIEFLHGDWFAPLAGRHFDLIASNPPYVGAEDPALDNLRYEPRVALTPGLAGTEALQYIVIEAPRYLAPGGWLVLEHGVGQAPTLAGSLQERGFTGIRCHRDYGAVERVTEAQWPGDRAL
jgi:release factor glutamine methyltransferase